MPKRPRFVLIIALVLAILGGGVFVALADTASSTSFSIESGVINSGGGQFATSANFSSPGTLGEPTLGLSQSATFRIEPGFLAFVTPPAAPSGLSATAASQSEIDLSWTDNSANESGFSIERKTGSGGAYSVIATTTANVASFSDTGLGSATNYYYQVRAFNTAGYSGYSNEANATTQSPSSSPPSSGGGGGGGGGYFPPSTSATFTGRAYPNSEVTVLKDGQVIASTIAGSDSLFSVSVSGLSGGNYIFSIYSEDLNGNRSSLLTFPVSVTAGAATQISGIFIAPTIAVDKTQVKQGDNLAIFGQTSPASQVTITVASDDEIFKQVPADKNGVYLYNLDTSVLDMGDHAARAKASLLDALSPQSSAVGFIVGTKTVLAVKNQKTLKGDSNNDGRVNLIDFSVMAYWYKRAKPPASVDLNGDGKVDLIDFSILAFYWTG